MCRHLAGVGPCLALTLLVGVGCARAIPATALHTTFFPDDSHPTSIRLSGLSSRELIELQAVDWSADRWHQLLGVTVNGASGTFVAGRYGVDGGALQFVPAFPFDAGRSYVVAVDPGGLVTPRAEPPVQALLTTTVQDAGPLANVTAVHPDMEEWPANLLRFYVHFSTAMSRDSGIRFVHVLDSKGKEISDSLLESPVDFWSPDQKRFTVFFDPGRVKSDLVPNLMLGRALRAGERYTIAIDRGWRDAQGRELAAEYRKDVRVVPAVTSALRVADWRLGSPRAGTRDPLVVSVPWPLDHALFERALGVTAGGELVAGRSEVQRGEREWRFVPAANWTATPHQLVVLSVLEDVSGNLIDQPFEVDPKTASHEARPDRYQIPFVPMP